MRWRLMDKVTGFEPWHAISGRKAVSVEEYYLLERLGREGVLPESLVLGCCAELTRWLIAVSSSFRASGLLVGVEQFRFGQAARMGDLLEVDARVADRGEQSLTAECRVRGDSGEIASGRLAFTFVPAVQLFEPDELQGLWLEVHGEP